MVEFGLALMFGSVVFCTTFVPAAAYFLNYGIKNPRPAPKTKELLQFKNLMPVYIRDMGFVTLSLAMFYYFMEFGTLNLQEVISLLLLFMVYVVLLYVMHQQRVRREQKEKKLREEDEKHQKEKGNQDNESG